MSSHHCIELVKAAVKTVVNDLLVAISVLSTFFADIPGGVQDREQRYADVC